MSKQFHVLIYGEGATDVGTVDIYNEWNKGCIPYLVEKVNSAVSIHFVPPPSKKDVTNVSTLRKKGEVRFEGHGKIVEKLILYASRKKIKYDLIAYYGDTDKETGIRNTPQQARRECEEAYSEASNALSFYNVSGIPIIPLRMLESWLLADSQAFVQAFGIPVTLPTNPEMQWGDKHDPNSNHPKRLLERTLTNCRRPVNTQTFIELVQHINLTTLERNCPLSFAPFIQAARHILI